MSATIIDGKAIAEELRAKSRAAAAARSKEHGIVPGLAVVLVGERSGEPSLCAHEIERR